MRKRYVFALYLMLVVCLSACGSSVSPTVSEVPPDTAAHDNIENTADIRTNLRKGLRNYAGDVFISVAPVTMDALLESESDVYCFGVLLDDASYLVRFCSKKVFLDEVHTLTFDNYFVETYLLHDPQDGLTGGSLQKLFNGSSVTAKQITAHSVNGADVGVLGNRDYLFQMNAPQTTEDHSSISEDGIYYFCTRSHTPVFLPYAKCAAYCKDTEGMDYGVVALMAAMLADRSNPIEHF